MIAIIDYDAGNLKSVEKALKYLGEDSIITRDFKSIEQADGVILPGVGAFGMAMDNLKKYELDKVIHEVCEKGTPFLGICLFYIPVLLRPPSMQINPESYRKHRYRLPDSIGVFFRLETDRY